MRKRGYLGYLVEGSAVALGLLAVAVAFLVSVNVMGRRWLEFSISWVVDFSYVAIVLMTFLGGTYVVAKGGHVRVDAFTSLLPERLRARVAAGSALFTGLIVGALALITSQQALGDLDSGRMFQGSSAMIFPRVWLTGTVAIGLWVLVIAFALEVRRVQHASTARLESGAEEGQ